MNNMSNNSMQRDGVTPPLMLYAMVKEYDFLNQ